MTAIAIKSRQVLRAGKIYWHLYNRFICSRACFGLLVLPAVQHTTQTLYTILVCSLVSGPKSRSHYRRWTETLRERNRTNLNMFREQSSQAYNVSNGIHGHLMSQNDTNVLSVVQGVLHSEFWPITLAHSLKLPRTVFKAQKSRWNKKV